MAKKKTATANDKKLKALEKKLYFICDKNDLNSDNTSDCIDSGSSLFIATEECLKEHISKFAKEKADDGYDFEDIDLVVFEVKRVGDVSVSSNPVVKISK